MEYQEQQNTDLSGARVVQEGGGRMTDPITDAELDEWNSDAQFLTPPESQLIPGTNSYREQVKEWKKRAFKLITELRQWKQGFYLPISCPFCSRQRLYYDMTEEGPEVECEKCNQKNWELEDKDTIWELQKNKNELISLLCRNDEKLGKLLRKYPIEFVEDAQILFDNVKWLKEADE